MGRSGKVVDIERQRLERIADAIEVDFRMTRESFVRGHSGEEADAWRRAARLAARRLGVRVTTRVTVMTDGSRVLHAVVWGPGVSAVDTKAAARRLGEMMEGLRRKTRIIDTSGPHPER